MVKKEDLLGMSVDLAKAHLSSSAMDPKEIPDLIRSIHATLLQIHSTSEPLSPESVAEAALDGDGKVAAVINEDISGPEFEGLDPWLAHRVTRRVAKKLNRDDTEVHASVFQDHLVCLEDGQEVKLLRPYVEKRFGLTFVEYMDKWGLPEDYPSAPPAYVAAKRALAQKSGLGASLRGKRGKAKPRQKAKL